MQSMSKDMDRISGLPEGILHHILSFVTTLEAVRMSLLSKRWRYLWASIPSLYFDQFQFLKLHNFEKEADTFREFIEKVLFLRRDEKNIRKFHLSTFTLKSSITEWIIYAAKRNVQELVLQLDIEDEPDYYYLLVELPPCLSDCGSLRVLKLDVQYYILTLPNAFSLSGLKALHLTSVISVEDLLGRLISSCPVLEDLYLADCVFQALNISNCELKKLSISYCESANLQVSAPSLLSFKFNPRTNDTFFLENMASLVEAYIDFNSLVDFSYYTMTFVEILQAISNVSVLHLSYVTDKLICLREELFRRVPEFHNLTYLKLITRPQKDKIETAVFILQHSPNLEILDVKLWPLMSFQSKEEESCCAPQEHSPEFLHLREIKIEASKRSLVLQEFINFLLRNSPCMERMTINFPKQPEFCKLCL